MSCCVKANKSIHCKCSDCSHSGKYHRPFFKRILNFSTYSSLPLVLLWVVMIVLVYYIKTQSVENQVFYPYHILGLKPGAPDSEIKEGIYPDKNPDPEANKYFVEKIVKTYQALTDPVSRENYEKYGHPDGRQGFEMGIAPLQFLLDMKRNGGILFLGIVGVDILLPLVIASCCISLKVGKIYRQLCHAPGVVHLLLLYEASLAPSKAMGVFIKAAEDTEIPVCRTDNVPLQKLLMLVRSELNLDLKNIKQEQAKFWKQHPALVNVETKLRSKGT